VNPGQSQLLQGRVDRGRNPTAKYPQLGQLDQSERIAVQVKKRCSQ
jgi:hypothetical protein